MSAAKRKLLDHRPYSDPELADDLKHILLTRATLSASAAQDTVARLLDEVCHYRLLKDGSAVPAVLPAMTLMFANLRKPKPSTAAFRSWQRKVIRQIEALERLLMTKRYDETDPSHRTHPSRVVFVPEVRKQLHRLKEHLQREVSGKPGRPMDMKRQHLELGIAVVLERAGVKVTKTADGTFARILEKVHIAIGVPDRLAGSHKSVRATCELLAVARAYVEADRALESALSREDIDPLRAL